MLPVNVLVAFTVLGLGVVALNCGLHKRFPKYGRFLGHTRFANYLMIAIFPIQAHYLSWSGARLVAIVAFAVPVWLGLHFGLMPVRNRQRPASQPAKVRHRQAIGACSPHSKQADPTCSRPKRRRQIERRKCASRGEACRTRDQH